MGTSRVEQDDVSAMGSFFRRLWGALRFDAAAYRDSAADPRGLAGAAVVVVVAGLVGGSQTVAGYGAVAALGGVAMGLAVWAGAAAAVWIVTLGVTGQRANVGRLVRALGFAATPLWLLILAPPLPALLQSVLWFAAHGIAAAAFVLAAREALGSSTATAALICSLALLIGLLLLATLG